ncbi:MAG: hypothetical protein EA379_03475 [Phycisphaerales bacterium]|nr:MAG: hypothetical protein EA379_03475 [Phycisphaerales bacterium]
MRYFILTLAYAAVLLLAGIVAFLLAPEGARATTALIVPGFAAAFMVLLAIGMRATAGTPTSKKIQLAAIAMAVLFALAFGGRAASASPKVRAHMDAQQAYTQAVETGATPDTPEARRAFFEARDAPPYSPGYLTRTLWLLCGASLGYAGAMLMRGKPVEPK